MSRARSALVRDVEHAVHVVVDVGTAVLILEAVLVLGAIRALVEVVGDAVAVANPAAARWRR